MKDEEKTKMKKQYIKNGYIYDVSDKIEDNATDEEIKNILDFLFFSGCNYTGEYEIIRHEKQINIFEKNIYSGEKTILISIR